MFREGPRVQEPGQMKLMAAGGCESSSSELARAGCFCYCIIQADTNNCAFSGRGSQGGAVTGHFSRKLCSSSKMTML